MIANVTCQVCGAAPGKPCLDITFAPLPGYHVERTEATPLHDALVTEQLVSPTPLSSRRRADAGTPRLATSARAEQSTRASTTAAGQGTRP